MWGGGRVEGQKGGKVSCGRVNRPGRCCIIGGQHDGPTGSIFSLAIVLAAWMQVQRCRELDFTQLFQVLPGKNNEAREGNKGVEGVQKTRF